MFQFNCHEIKTTPTPQIPISEIAPAQIDSQKISTATPVDNVNGKIVTVAMQIVKFDKPTQSLILALLKNGKGLSLVCASLEIRQQIEQWLLTKRNLIAGFPQPTKIEFVPFQSQRTLEGRWSRDNMLVLVDKDGVKHLVEPLGGYRKDSDVPDSFYKKWEPTGRVKLAEAPFYFEGGNVRVCGDTVFIGAETLNGRPKEPRKPDPNNPSPQVIRTQVNQYFQSMGKKVVWVGENSKATIFQKNESDDGKTKIAQAKSEKQEQFIFHIDMYFTPTGKFSKKTGKEIILMPDPVKTLKAYQSMAQAQIKAGKVLEKITIEGVDYFIPQTRPQVFLHPNLIKAITAEREEMKSKGYEIVDTPLVPFFSSPMTVEAYDEHLEEGHKLDPKFYTHNNVLIESYHEKSGPPVTRIYFPKYSQDPESPITPEIESIARESYREVFGNDVQFEDIDGAGDWADKEGVVNCATTEFRQ